MRHDTTTADGRRDDFAELFVSPDGEKQVARFDALRVHLLARVTCKLNHFRDEVLQQRGAVDRSGASAALLLQETFLEAAVNTTNWKVEASTC